MINWPAVARFLGAIIDLIMLEKQLDILEITKDKAYELADRQVVLAELIVALHCELLAKVPDYYLIANDGKIYTQQYNCAMDLANTDVIREANRAMNAKLDTTSMYSTGLRRDYIESAMGGLVFASSGQFALAYRNEDDLNTLTDLNHYKHMVDSISAGSLFTGHATMSRLAQNTVDLAQSTSRLAESHLEGFITGVTDWVAGPSRDTTSNEDVRKQVNAARDDRLRGTESDIIAPISPRENNITSRRLTVQETGIVTGAVNDPSLNSNPSDSF